MARENQNNYDAGLFAPDNCFDFLAPCKRCSITQENQNNYDAGLFAPDICPEEANMKAPIRVTITGAAGQIGYAALFRIANGDMLWHEQPIILQLLDLPQAQTMLRGVMMELEDCAFPLLQQIIITDDPKVALRDTETALLIGARPRSKGMERKDLMEANGAIFSEQGKLLNEYADRHVKVLVVATPANTNALIAMKNAPDLDPRNFT